MKKVKSFFLSLVITFSALCGVLPIACENIPAADALSYPAQAVNFAAYTTNRNMNLSGTKISTQKAAGADTENWRIDYISDGIYNIVSMSSGNYLTANGAQVSTASKNETTSQQWKIEGVEKDFEGFFLYYKITSVSDGTVLTYYQTSNVVGLASYTKDGAQKWKLNCYGCEGYAANCKVSQGEKACTIGGLLGKTVFVGTVEDMISAMKDTKPLTIVVSKDLDFKNWSKTDQKIEDNKTIIGSYSANNVYDLQWRTDDFYGDASIPPSNNIIIRNISVTSRTLNGKVMIQVYSSRNVWFDHCTFNNTLSYDRNGNGQDEVGKYIWINTPPMSWSDEAYNGISPDYITISYCKFSGRYWTVAYGTQNTETTRCRTSVMYNMWYQCVRRCPQIGNGTGHIYNNYYEGYDNGNGSGTSQIIGGDGSNMVSENNRFQAFTPIQALSMGGGSDPARDSGSYLSSSSSATPDKISFTPKNTSTLYPNKSNYGYSLIDAYNTKGTDTKNFCTKYSGAASQKYITDNDMSGFVTTKYSSPFLTESFDSEYGSPVTEYTPAVLNEGAVYTIKNVNSGLYMEVDGAKQANGTNVQQWGIGDTPASHNTWRVLSAGDGYYYLYSQIGDKVKYLLDVDSNKDENGTNIDIWSATGADAQKFKFYKNSDGSYLILTKTSKDQKCVAVSNASANAGETIIQWQVGNDDNSQKWILTQVEDTGCVMDTSKAYTFKNVNSGLYMEVESGKAENNANVQQWGMGDEPSLHNSWTLKEFGGGYYYIISRLADGNTYYLNINDSNVEILKNNKTSSHLFKFVKNPDGSYNILTRTSKDKSAVEVVNADKSSGANVQQWTVNGNSCQKWNAETFTVTTASTSASTTETTVTTEVSVSTETSTNASTSTSISIEHPPIIGDINLSDNVSVADYVMLKKFLVKEIEFTSDVQFKCADITQDGIINIFDDIMFKRWFIKK